MIYLEIKINLGNEKNKIFFKSILPELEGKFPRSEILVAQKKDQLKIDIKAQDKTAARATLNGIMKPLILFNELNEIN